MKSTKKILLFGVGAMAALALGVGATSTFAWYTATTSAVLKAAADTTGEAITVGHVQYDVGDAEVDGLVVDVQAPTWANKDGGKKLELAHVPDSGVENYNIRNAPGLSTAWYDTQVRELGFDENGLPVTAGTGNDLYGSISVKLTTQDADDTYGYHHSADDIADDLDEKYITVTFSNKEGAGAEAIRFFANASVKLAASANSADELSVAVQLDADDLKGEGQFVSVYFFILGDNITDANISEGSAAAGTVLVNTSASRDSE